MAHSEKLRLGLIGLGAMGSGLAHSLLRHFSELRGFDPNPAAMETFVRAGGTPMGSATELLDNCDCIVSSLPSGRLFEKLAHNEWLPRVREGQLFIDTTTVPPAIVESLAGAFASKGAILLDAPVSGGPHGAMTGNLYVFVGGTAEGFVRARPVLDCLGPPESITHCGPSGFGQRMKGVNQLAMGLINAATLEAVSYGVRSGLDPALPRQAVGGENGFRGLVAWIAGAVSNGKGGDFGIKYDQLGDFLEDAARYDAELPLARHLEQLLEEEPLTVPEANQMTPSYWDYLKKAQSPREPS